ncbi:MAG TPA: biotin-dependent carboxyltransferase family protein [Nordella sp.]|nr:biotin-dependent carboxyltransferase family protein [Nordella sp.]
MSSAFDVVKPGLETSIQELPGRIGFWEQGFPPSGPMDLWSFRFANLLVGNDRDMAALECQLIGPAIRFTDDRLIAVTGADMAPKLDGEELPMWRTVSVRAGQLLELAPARRGMRSYIAICGGIATEPVLGSRATFHMAGVGGMNGYALKPDQRVPLGRHRPSARRMTAPEDSRPRFSTDKSWTIECVLGPNDDWLAPEAVAMFFASPWTVQSRSNRTGMRLTGPQFTFAPRATGKRPEHGQDPSNILDHGYPLGAVNLAGQTPIILVNDAPSTGGFINPFTVASAAFWKLGQALPNETLRFKQVGVEEAQNLRRDLDRRTTIEALVPLAV